MIAPDFLIVGSGLTGAVFARKLYDAGYSVFVLERRNHLAGNVFDYSHESGIRVHRYGPHFFRTSSKQIWDFVTGLTPFYHYEARLKTRIDGELRHWPIHRGDVVKSLGKKWRVRKGGTPENFKEACLTVMPEDVYDMYVKEYTEKQWGVPPEQLDARLATRIEIRTCDDTRLKQSEYQGIPQHGYTELIRQLLSDIPILLNCDYLSHRETFQATKMVIYTGSIDEYYQYEFGRLRYRTQVREHEYRPDGGCALDAAVVNNPTHDGGPHVRTIEWKQLMQETFAERIEGTVLTVETPGESHDPHTHEYPFPDTENQYRYKQYAKRAEQDAEVLFCGRLGEYRYYDMDQAIARALVLVEKVLQSVRSL